MFSHFINYVGILGETIRFRVTSESFQETSPAEPPGLDHSSSTNTTSNVAEGGTNNSKTPYRLLATINEPGLGLLTWWENNSNEVQEEDAEGEERDEE